MSYEGYYQILCKHGHYSTVDCYDMCEHEDWKCSKCGEKMAWWNSVNTTNGSFCPAWEDGKCIEKIPEGYDDCDGLYPYQLCNEEQLARCKKNCGRIDGYVELEVEQEEEQKLCLWCGCSKVVKEKTYKIPEGVGQKEERKM